MQHRMILRAAAVGAFLVTLQVAHAQNVKPGLWETTSKMKTGSGQMEQAMAQAQKQMASLPPEQRKMMEEMMAKQGVSMGASGAPGTTTAKYCISREMAETNTLPAQQEGNCKSTASPRVGNTMKIGFTCTNPVSSGEGTITFTSAEAYTTKMTMNTSAGGKPETINLDASSKWLSADCGALRPLAPPKK